MLALTASGCEMSCMPARGILRLTRLGAGQSPILLHLCTVHFLAMQAVVECECVSAIRCGPSPRYLLRLAFQQTCPRMAPDTSARGDRLATSVLERSTRRWTHDDRISNWMGGCNNQPGRWSRRRPTISQYISLYRPACKILETIESTPEGGQEPRALAKVLRPF